MVLDKTGTLTEDGLQVYGFRSVKGPDVTQVAESQSGKPAVDFNRFHEAIDYLVPED